MWVRLVPPDKKLRLSAVHRLCHCLVEVYFTTLLGIHTTTTMNTGDTEHLLHLTEAVLRFVLLPKKNARDSVGSASIGEILKCTNHGSRSESTGIWHIRIVIYKNLAWGENFLIRNYSSSGLVQNKSRIRIEFYASLLPALGLLGVGQWMEGYRPLWICVFVVKKIIDILHLLRFFLDSKNKDCTTNYSSEN